jgi:lysozyme
MTPIVLKGIPTNVVKFLMLITETEGTDKQGTPYNELFGYDNFKDYATHPNIKVKKGALTSTAAGRYQILKKTFDGLKMKDFTPASQDQAAIDLIKGRKAYQDILNGDFKTAILKCNKEWASLPESPYGQPTHTMSKALEFINTIKL